jgi:paired small multidrug resistance pump
MIRGLGGFKMNRAWAMVIIAALFEVSWVIGMKHAQSPLEWAGTFIAILISFYLMIKAGKTIPVGTVYAVFVGLGTAGTVIAEILLFQATIKPAKLALLGLLLAGVIILKLQSNEKKSEVAATTSDTLAIGKHEGLGSQHHDNKEDN